MKRKKLIPTILFVATLFVLAYSQKINTVSFALNVSGPPEITGPYHVSSEASIYGPIVDLAAVKAITGGSYSDDFSYVQWGYNPFYRVYLDNTLQGIYSGQMLDLLSLFNWGFSIEYNLRTQFNILQNNGAVHSTAILGNQIYLGNIPGTIISLFNNRTNPTYYSEEIKMNIETSQLYGYIGRYSDKEAGNGVESKTYGYLRFSINNTGYIYSSSRQDEIYINPYDETAYDFSESFEAHKYHFTINNYANRGYKSSWPSTFYYLEYQKSGVSIYLEDLLSFTTADSDKINIYNITEAPGTGFVIKSITPMSPVAGSNIIIKSYFNPPSATNIELTDSYLSSFSWASIDVLLEKYTIGSDSVDSTDVHVVPYSDGSNMKFDIDYTQAPTILTNLVNDDYLCITYSLTVPNTPGEYTLPSASMTYYIPTP